VGSFIRAPVPIIHQRRRRTEANLDHAVLCVLSPRLDPTLNLTATTKPKFNHKFGPSEHLDSPAENKGISKQICIGVDKPLHECSSDSDSALDSPPHTLCNEVILIAR
jgi:hypothetical protein